MCRNETRDLGTRSLYRPGFGRLGPFTGFPASSLLFELVDHEHGDRQWGYFGGIYAN